MKRKSKKKEGGMRTRSTHWISSDKSTLKLFGTREATLAVKGTCSPAAIEDTNLVPVPAPAPAPVVSPGPGEESDTLLDCVVGNCSMWVPPENTGSVWLENTMSPPVAAVPDDTCWWGPGTRDAAWDWGRVQ
jgi:hypothetical protein